MHVYRSSGRKWEEFCVLQPSDEMNETQKSQRADGIRRVVSVESGLLIVSTAYNISSSM